MCNIENENDDDKQDNRASLPDCFGGGESSSPISLMIPAEETVMRRTLTAASLKCCVISTVGARC